MERTEPNHIYCISRGYSEPSEQARLKQEQRNAPTTASDGTLALHYRSGAREEASDLSAGTARFMPHTCRLQYLSGSAQLLGNRGRFAQHPVTGLICSLTLGTLLRSRVVLSVSARPDRCRESSILRRKGAFWGLAFAIARVI